MSVTVMIGADVAPTEASRGAFSSGRLFSDALLDEWERADARVFNLECPFTDSETPIEKCGMALRAPTDCFAGIRALRPSAAALANNHILDQGKQGLRSTLGLFRDAGIPTFGAGMTAHDADSAATVLINGERVTFYAVAEHEFSVAEGDGAGANGLDLIEIADRVRELKRSCEHLVVLCHGGREFDPYPSPMLRKLCRKLVSVGADAVLCQHSHTVGCREGYAGGEILYGQGNLLFDLDGEREAFYTGLIARITFDRGVTHAEYLPIARDGHGAKLLTGAEADAVLRPFFDRSEEIAREGFVEERYARYAAESKEKLMKVFLSGNPVLRVLCRIRGRRPTRVYPRETQLAIRNTLTCESIRELLTEGMKR